MISVICAEIRNYFLAHREQDIHNGDYVIDGGTIDLTGLVQNGQYFRIVGSAMNDGVYRYPVNDLQDEEFSGSIWTMSVPPSFVCLVDEITDWVQKNGQAINSPYTSESFGGYSYTKASGANGKGFAWQDQFATRLNAFRRISVL